MRVRDIKLGHRLIIAAVIESTLFIVLISYGVVKFKQILNYFPVYSTMTQVNDDIWSASFAVASYNATYEEKYIADVAKYLDHAANELMPRIKEGLKDTEENRNFYTNAQTQISEYKGHLLNMLAHMKDLHTRTQEIEAKLAKPELHNVIVATDNRLGYLAFRGVQQLTSFQTNLDPKIFEEAVGLFASIHKTIERAAPQNAVPFKEVEDDVRLLPTIAQKAVDERMASTKSYAEIQKCSQYLSSLLETATARYSGGAMIFIIGVLVLMVAIILFFALYTGRKMSTIFKIIVDALELMRGGDLKKTSLIRASDLDRKDEAGNMIRAMVALREKMAELLGLVMESVDGVLNAGREMEQTARLIAQGANTQASSSEEVSSAMEEMSANIDQNADNAQQSEKVSQLVADALKEVLTHGVESKNAIQEIEQKIDVVNEIASQTNILALNAAVEAARAGEHGRGFAVVASEVRKLAERSAEAANEVVGLVNAAVQASALIEQALAEVAPRVEKSVQLSREVAVASVEQRNGAEQVNQSVQLLSDVSQENAVSSDRMATSAQSLMILAEDLKKAFSYFQFDGTSQRVVHSAAPVAPATPKPAAPAQKSSTTANTVKKVATPVVPKETKPKAVQVKPQTEQRPTKPVVPPAPKKETVPPAQVEEKSAEKPTTPTQQSEANTAPAKPVERKPTPRPAAPTTPSAPSTPTTPSTNGRKPGVHLDMSSDNVSDADYESF